MVREGHLLRRVFLFLYFNVFINIVLIYISFLYRFCFVFFVHTNWVGGFRNDDGGNEFLMSVIMITKC